MSIEKDLKDNTAALKANTEILQKLYDLKTNTTSTAAAPTPATPTPMVAAPAPTPATPTPATPTPMAPALAPAPTPAPATPLAVLSAEEMNTFFVTEYKRIGKREPIDAAMAAMGVVSVTDIPAEKQQELIAAVQAIPA